VKVANSSYSLDLSLRALVQVSRPNKGPVEGTSEEVVLREEPGFYSLKPILVFGGSSFQESGNRTWNLAKVGYLLVITTVYVHHVHRYFEYSNRIPTGLPMQTR
jgi:hypothetical protein